MRIERWLYTVPLRVRSLFRRDRVEDELDEELRLHVDRLTDEHIAKGLRPADARLAALRAMHGIEQRKEECRDTRRVRFVEDLGQDLRYGVRVLLRSPGFTAIAVLSLALGIGANTAIFQLIEALGARPLPVAKPRDLAIVEIANRGWPSGDYSGRYAHVTYPVWEAVRANQQPFTGVLAWGHATFDLAASGESRFAEDGLWVSGAFFNVLGVPPAVGRVFTEADDVRGCRAPGIVLSHAFWQREFGGSPSAIGATLTVKGHPLEVIGVSSAGFHGVEIGRSFDFALPLCAQPLIDNDRGNGRLDEREIWWLSILGRLKPGSSVAQASAQLEAISPAVFQLTVPSSYGEEDAAAYRAFRLRALPGGSGFSQLRQEYDTPLWMLLAAAGVGLLIACANVANLMLARMGTRSREMAVRLALGASRRRLVRQLLVESLLLAGAGAACGAALAPVLSGAVVTMIGSEVSPLFVDLAMDWRWVGFAAALALSTCVLFGLAPALRASRVPPGETMKAGGRSFTAGRTQLGLRRALVATQVAMALVLLVGGLLFGRSFFNLLTLDAGFQQARILEADIDMTRLDRTPDGTRALQGQLAEVLRALPDVEAVSTASTVPLVGNWYRRVFLSPLRTPGPGEGGRDAAGLRQAWPNFSRVSGGYFDTLRIPLVSGRDFDRRDTPGSPPAAIVNESFVRKFLGDTSPLGINFQLEGTQGKPGATVQIVGVVKDTKYGNLREDFKPVVYLAESQNETPGAFAQFLIRGRSPAAALRPAVARALGSRPGLAFHFHDFQAQIRYSIRQDRLMATLCGFFAALGALLAAIGVYGVNAYAVAQRTNEIGLRVALGADRRAILTLILREAGLFVAAGLFAGTAVAALTARALRSMLFGLQPDDPATLLAAVVLLSTAALAASYFPARRASQVDPMVALRAE